MYVLHFIISIILCLASTFTGKSVWVTLSVVPQLLNKKNIIVCYEFIYHMRLNIANLCLYSWITIYFWLIISICLSPSQVGKFSSLLIEIWFCRLLKDGRHIKITGTLLSAGGCLSVSCFQHTFKIKSTLTAIWEEVNWKFMTGSCLKQ